MGCSGWSSSERHRWRSSSVAGWYDGPWSPQKDPRATWRRPHQLCLVWSARCARAASCGCFAPSATVPMVYNGPWKPFFSLTSWPRRLWSEAAAACGDASLVSPLNSRGQILSLIRTSFFSGSPARHGPSISQAVCSCPRHRTGVSAYRAVDPIRTMQHAAWASAHRGQYGACRQRSVQAYRGMAQR